MRVSFKFAEINLTMRPGGAPINNPLNDPIKSSFKRAFLHWNGLLH